MSSISAVYNRKNKSTFAVVSLKSMILPVIFVLFTIGLILFSNSNLIAAKNGLKLWANNVVPTLFPFFIATNLLSHTNVIYYISKAFNKIMKPLFNVPGESAYAFIIGLISGYPIGAKIVTDLRNSNLCSKDEGERMLCFTNNSGPLFIIGTVRNKHVCKFNDWSCSLYNACIISYYYWLHFRFVFEKEIRILFYSILSFAANE